MNTAHATCPQLVLVLTGAVIRAVEPSMEGFGSNSDGRAYLLKRSDQQDKLEHDVPITLRAEGRPDYGRRWWRLTCSSESRVGNSSCSSQAWARDRGGGSDESLLLTARRGGVLPFLLAEKTDSTAQPSVNSHQTPYTAPAVGRCLRHHDEVRRR